MVACNINLWAYLSTMAKEIKLRKIATPLMATEILLTMTAKETGPEVSHTNQTEV